VGSDPAVAAPDAAQEPQPIDIAADMGATTATSATTESRKPSHDEIAELAYRRYLDRGGQHGSDFDDWLEAERALRQPE
jgi:hypothetical protein